MAYMIHQTGESLSFPTFLVWFAAGVAVVVGVVLRNSEVD